MALNAYDRNTLRGIFGRSWRRIVDEFTQGGGTSLPDQSGHADEFLKTDGSALSWDAPSGSGDMLKATYDPTTVSGDAFDMDNMVAGSTNKLFTSSDETKLDGIETGADVTDATNVEAAGAVMDSDLINTSAGAGDAGKPIKLDAAGHVDATMINDGDVDHDNIANTHNLTTDIDHDQLTNFTADEHIDWTQESQGTIHASNYVDGDTIPILTKSITVESPDGTEDISFFFTDIAITINKMVAVLVGSSTPSVTWTVRHSTDRSATGNEVATGGTTTTSVTTGSTVTSFDDATIPADSFVWLETSAQSGTVGQMFLSVEYTED